jgi:hypothetical protein
MRSQMIPRDPVDLERGRGCVALAALLRIEERIRDEDGHLVPHLGRDD